MPGVGRLRAGVMVALVCFPVDLPAHRSPGLWQAAPATGMILGQVVDAAGGRGVGESVVTLSVAAAPGSAPLSPAARDAASRKVITDGSGRFVFTGLVPGRYTITSARPGYTAGNHGKLVPRGPGAPVDLGDRERLTDVRLLVWKHAVITGRVVDEGGEPVVGASVKIFRRSAAAGRPGVSEIATAVTDDRGLYRAAALEPGSYVVGVPSTSTSIPTPMMDEYARASGPSRVEMQQALFSAAPTLAGPVGPSHLRIGDHLLQVEGRMVTPPASGPDGRQSIYPSVFYPSVGQLASAETITLTSGEVRAGVDLQLTPSIAYRVEGHIQGPDGPVGIAALHLMPATPALSGAAASTPAGTTVANAAGAFTFLGVPPGQYVIRILKQPAPQSTPAQVTVVQTPAGTAPRGVAGGPAPPSPLPTWWASQPVSIADRDVRDLRVTVQSGYRVSGSIEFEGGVPSVPVQRFAPFLETADSWLSVGIPEMVVTADGAFASAQVPPGRYRFTVPTPSNWFVKSVRAGGRDLSELPFDLNGDLAGLVVTISNRGARVFGTVRADGTRVDTSATVMLFPVDPRQWVDFSTHARGIKESRAGRDGTYALADLPAGEYFVVAVPQTAVDRTRPGFLESLSRLATRVTLSEGDARALDLKTAQVK